MPKPTVRVTTNLGVNTGETYNLHLENLTKVQLSFIRCMLQASDYDPADWGFKKKDGDLLGMSYKLSDTLEKQGY